MATIDQDDIAQLTDTQVKVFAVRMFKSAEEDPSDPAAPFWLALSYALARAMRERRGLWLTTVADLCDDDPDGEGEIVPDTPPG